MKRTVGRYSLHDEIASGGMATVYLARQRGEQGFSRVVAVKMLHAQYAKEEAFRAMFLDEARLVSRIRHPNVVATLDVLEDGGELFLIMEYVHGAPLSALIRSVVLQGKPVPASVASAIFVDTLEGLHAAHEARSEKGVALDIVHRDVSPQNILVGVDGIAHVVDFGVAKAVGRLAEKFSVHHTVKGKAGYMAAEQVRGKVDRRTDVYAAGVVLWETLTGERLYTGDSFMEIIAKSLDGAPPPPSDRRPDIGDELEAVVLKALDVDPKNRFATAREMAIALEKSTPRASAREVGEWVRGTDETGLLRRQAQIARIERGEEQENESEKALERLEPEAVSTIAGVAPPEEAVRGAPRRWWLVLAAAVVASLATLLVRPLRETATSTRAASAVRAMEAPRAAAPEGAPPLAASPAPAASSPEPEPLPSGTADAPAPRPVRRVPAPRPKANAPRVADASAGASPCHWEQLPDPDGILIPKRVCP